MGTSKFIPFDTILATFQPKLYIPVVGGQIDLEKKTGRSKKKRGKTRVTFRPKLDKIGLWTFEGRFFYSVHFGSLEKKKMKAKVHARSYINQMARRGIGGRGD